MYAKTNHLKTNNPSKTSLFFQRIKLHGQIIVTSHSPWALNWWFFIREIFEKKNQGNPGWCIWPEAWGFHERNKTGVSRCRWLPTDSEKFWKPNRNEFPHPPLKTEFLVKLATTLAPWPSTGAAFWTWLPRFCSRIRRKLPCPSCKRVGTLAPGSPRFLDHVDNTLRVAKGCHGTWAVGNSQVTSYVRTGRRARRAVRRGVPQAFGWIQLEVALEGAEMIALPGCNGDSRSGRYRSQSLWLCATSTLKVDAQPLARCSV